VEIQKVEVKFGGGKNPNFSVHMCCGMGFNGKIRYLLVHGQCHIERPRFLWELVEGV